MATYQDLERAIQIAVAAHAGQTDKAGAPYILHPLRVMAACDSIDEKTVAVLHDVLEDTAISSTDLLAEGFPAEIVEVVECLTRRDGETYGEFIERAGQNQLAARVKIADLNDNLDVRRLSTVTDADIDRLNKYLAARDVLQEKIIS